MIPDVSAACIQYQLFRRKELTVENKIVAIVDIGASKTTIAIVGFNKDGFKIYSKACDKHLGGRDFDYLILEYLNNNFNKKYNLSCLNNGKAFIRLLEASNKTKQILSGCIDSTVNIDCFMEDEDINDVVTRDILEELSKPLLEKLDLLLKQAKKDYNVVNVELLGGMTRMPIIKSKLMEFFKVDQLMNTLNSDEAFAKGASISCAILSPNFQVKEVKIED